MTLSVIIPVKNEEEIILNTLNHLENSWLADIEHEILIINDNSTDETVNLIKKNKFNKINIVLKNNYKKGLGSAILTGIENSSKKYISIYMADISDSLDDLSLYYKEIISDNTLDAVFGSRFVKGSKVSNYPKFKLFLNRFANNLIKIIFFYKYNDFTNEFPLDFNLEGFSPPDSSESLVWSSKLTSLDEASLESTDIPITLKLTELLL